VKIERGQKRERVVFFADQSCMQPSPIFTCIHRIIHFRSETTHQHKVEVQTQLFLFPKKRTDQTFPTRQNITLAMCVRNCVPSSSECASLECMESSCKRLREKEASTRSRKRVRFEPSKTEASQVKEQVLHHGPSCSELSAEEKEERWIQQAEWGEIRRSANADAQDCRREDTKKVLRGEPHLAFSELYSKVYAVCHLENVDKTEDIVQLISTEMLMLMAQSQARGLEDRKVPQIAYQRRVLRKQVIRLVLHIQLAMGSEPETIREVSEILTNPSRKFAEVLGVTDATAAMLEYSASPDLSSGESSPEEQDSEKDESVSETAP
jgi:hypothetical protein